MIISFAWTAEALLAGKKTVTRRCWKDSHAAKFKPGALHDAYDKIPIAGGKKIARVRIVSVMREPLDFFRNADYAARELALEGGLWESADQFVKLFPPTCSRPWRVEFKLESVENAGLPERSDSFTFAK